MSFAENSRQLYPLGVCEDSNFTWFTVAYPNIIIRVDMRSNATRRFIIDPRSISNTDGYRFMHIVGDEIVLVPSNSDMITVFDKNTYRFKHVDLREFSRPKNENYFVKVRFSCSFAYQDSVYMLGGFYPAIVKLDLKTSNITYYTEWVEEIDEMTENGDTCGHFGPGSVVKDSVAYAPVACANALLQIGLLDDSIKIRTIDSGYKGYYSLASCAGSDYIWASSRHVSDSGSIICLDLSSETINRFCFPDSKVDTLYNLVEFEDEIYAFPESGGHVYVIDNDTKTICIAEKLESVLVNNLAEICKTGYISPHFVGTDLYITTSYDCCRHVIDMSNCDEKNRVYFVRDRSDYELSNELIRNSIKKDLVLNEKDFSVDEFINGLLY